MGRIARPLPASRGMLFYELLGFTKSAGPIGPEPAAILDHPSGVEVSLVLND